MATYLKGAKPKPQEGLASVWEIVREITEKARAEGETGVRNYPEKLANFYSPSLKPGEREIPNINKQLLQSMVKIAEVCERPYNHEKMLAHGISCRV